MDSLQRRVAIPGSDIENVIQLRNAYLYDVKIVREATQAPAMTEAPRLDPKIRGWSLDDDGHTLIVVLEASIRHQFRPEATVDVNISVAGHFHGRDAIDEAAARSFANLNGLLLLWPYLRSYVGILASATQLNLPTLPVIDTAALMERVSTASAAADSASR